MNTKKLSEVQTVKDIADKDNINIIQSDGSIGNILKSDFVNSIVEILPAIPGNKLIPTYAKDLNTVHLENDTAGLYLHRMLSDAQNCPVSTGSMIHIQRITGTTVSTSQHVFQLVFSGASIRIRTGSGNGTEVIFNDWERIY